MKCIVTAGPTYESLDQVRRLTNFSTGALGSGLASYLAARGHDVTLLRGYYAIAPVPEGPFATVSFSTTADLADRLRALSEQSHDAVFHAAAVSDFTFGRAFTRSAGGELVEIKSGKFSTKSGPLLVELTPTPKIISSLRAWFPGAYLVGWKYEVDGGRTDALAAGAEQLQRCQTNACVVNGPAYGTGFGVMTAGAALVSIEDDSALYEILTRAAFQCD